MDRQRKRELRELNLKAWAGDRDVLNTSEHLDSSLKKNTAFIKRLRTAISAQGVSTFLQEIRTLSLHKYLSEIISACYEGLTKLKVPADVAAGVEIFSALHQRFGPDEFTAYVGWLIGRGLSTPDRAHLKQLAPDVREKEEKERIVRQRALLRVATDLWLVGALRSLDDVTRPEEAVKAKENHKTAPAPSKTAVNGTRASAVPSAAATTAAADAEPFPLEVLKDILSQDDQHVALPMVVQFIKSFALDILGKPELELDLASKTDEPLIDEKMQQRFRNVLTQYFDGAKKHLVRDQTTLNNQGRRNAEAYVRSGEIFEDRQASYEKMVKNHEKFVANMQVLAEAIDIEMPDLKEKESSSAISDGSIGLVKAGEYLRGTSEGAGIWEDEEERRFYENLIDVKDRVPGILLEDARSKKKGDGEEPAAAKKDDESAQPQQSEDTTDPTKKDADADASVSIANKTVGAQVDTLLARLPELSSKEAVDQLAIDFCFVNSKASRNRLVKALEDPPRGRTDLLPFWARLITTLGRYMHDVVQAIVTYLDDEFRSLQRRKQKDTLGGVRTSNIRYLAELTKFGLVPEHVIFHCLKVSLDDFSRMNIEIICSLLENCGKYLLRNPETTPRMKSFLDTLARKKGAAHLGTQERMLVENAIYFVDPPERAAILQKERTPIDLFVRKLVYNDLNKRNAEKIIKQIRKLHWEEQEVVAILHKVFVKPARIKYSNINLLAIILGSLNRYHPEFTIAIIDDLLENVTLGLEINDFKHNQRRLADARYLGELYAYRMIDSTVLFHTLFHIATYGHSGWPRPGVLCPLDLPDDFFRLRLVCAILETCGMYFEKGVGKKKMDFFLTFFQYYIQTKDRMPMDTEFVVQDTFAQLRPSWKISENLDDAGNLFAEACKETYKADMLDKAIDEHDPEHDHDEHDDMDDGPRSPGFDDDAKSSDDDAEDEAEEGMATPDGETSDSVEDDDEEHIIVKRPDEGERDPEADAEFDREFAKILAESVEGARKAEAGGRRPNFDIALPMRKTHRGEPGTGGSVDMRGTAAGDDSGGEGAAATTNGATASASASASAPGTIKFSVLSKKGNRQQTRSIDLPQDSSFAIAMRNQQEADKAEQQRIKALVLNYDMRNEEDHESLPTLHRGPVQSAAAIHGGQNSQHGQHSAQRGAGKRQQQQPARRLQFSDVDW